MQTPQQCIYCHEPIDPNQHVTYRKGTAWFRSNPTGRVQDKAGTNRAVRPQWHQEWACRFCMGKIINNIPVEQMELFKLDEEGA